MGEEITPFLNIILKHPFIWGVLCYNEFVKSKSYNMPPEIKPNPMENLRGIVMLVGVLLAVFLVLSIADKSYGVVQNWSNKNPKNVMTVSAEGKVKSEPDTATVNIGVLTQAATTEDAQKENSAKTNKIIDFVKSQGIPSEDISTSSYNIYPNYDYANGKNTVTGYQVNQSITVEIKEINGKNKEKLGTVLSGVTANGANQVNGVSLSFDDPDGLRQKAREQAIVKAKQKAQELAKASGITLGRVVNVSEAGTSGGPIAYADSYSGAAPTLEKSVSPNIEPGQQDITATMTVTFEVK